MNRKYYVLTAAVLGLSFAASAAYASPRCTKEPKSKWLPEAAMRQKVADMGYKDIKIFKTTSTGCYEIYGRTADGHKAEVYFNPVNGAVVEKNVD
ncbi:MAG: PepSY domain-containing protein [Acidiphilium sp.]|nr:PepSY domain-containing protein [Acidiphilium sp.]MDD4936751.1 PepSY domain-containing protein [Acidiphilium sp.]